MSFIYDRESMSDLDLISVGVRVLSWDFVFTITRRKA